ncbi:MAG: hypothetical protein QOH88_3145 [Verrucomicrobiota bacterium]|jgi:hypothetical protein
MCIDGASLEETTVQNLYGCWRDFYLAAWQIYALTDDSWDGAGISDACNVSLPFAKVLNSIFLINYALSDNYIPQWHSTEDYGSSSRAADNRFHGPFYQRFIEYDGSANASTETGRFAARDRTDLHCPLFNLGAYSNSPSARAGTMLHESWHHWQHRHGFVTDHPQCGSPGHDCDYYYFHGSGAYDFGQLDRYNLDRNNFHFHSPRQVQVEFLADLAELSKFWVPTITTQAARVVGNDRLTSEFVNTVAYRIGKPRPF